MVTLTVGRVAYTVAQATLPRCGWQARIETSTANTRLRACIDQSLQRILPQNAASPNEDLVLASEANCLRQYPALEAA